MCGKGRLVGGTSTPHLAKTDKSDLGQQTNKQKEREMFEFSVDYNRYPLEISGHNTHTLNQKLGQQQTDNRQTNKATSRYKM